MFLLPQLFLLRPIRQAAGHTDGSWWCRQWDVLVWWPTVHGVLGFHCQGKKHFNEVMLFCLFCVVCCCLIDGESCRWWCLFHRSGSARLIAHPVTRDPSFSYWLSWSMMLGWVRRLNCVRHVWAVWGSTTREMWSLCSIRGSGTWLGSEMHVWIRWLDMNQELKISFITRVGKTYFLIFCAVEDGIIITSCSFFTNTLKRVKTLLKTKWPWKINMFVKHWKEVAALKTNLFSSLTLRTGEHHRSEPSGDSAGVRQ